MLRASSRRRFWAVLLVGGATAAQGAGATVTGGTQLLFTNPSLLVAAGACSQPLTVTLTDGLGVPIDTSTPQSFTLGTSSSTGSFYADSLCSSASTTAFTIAAGNSSVDVYYRDSTPGLPAVTITSASPLVGSYGSQTEAVFASITLDGGVAAPLVSLSFSNLPGSVAAGTALSPTVTATDPTTHLPAATYSGTVHFTSTDSNAVLPPDYTFTAADNGSHTFTGQLIFMTAQTESVTVTDVGNPSVTATSAPIAVSLSQPSITQDAIPYATAGVPYPYNALGRITTTSAPVDTYGTCNGGLSGFFVDPTTGAVSWTPTASQAGSTFQLCVEATNGAGTTQYQFQVTVQQPGGTGPTAAISASPDAGVAPLAELLNGAGSTGGSQSLAGFRWVFGDGSEPGADDPVTHTYELPGGYWATLTVFNKFGLSATARAPVQALSPDGERGPLARIQASALSGTDLLSATFSCACQAGDAPIQSYTWSPAPASQGPTAALTFGPGTTTVRLTVTDANGLTSSDSVQVVVGKSTATGTLQPPTCHIYATPPAMVAPYDVKLTTVAWPGSSAITTPNIVTLFDGSRSSSATVWRTVPGPGHYGARLDVTDSNGLTCSDTVEVLGLGATGAVPPRIVSAPSPHAPPFCGVKYTYQPLAAGTPPFTWSLSTSPALNGATVDPATGLLTLVPVPTPDGGITAQLTVRNAAGSATQVVTLSPQDCSLYAKLGGCAASPVASGAPDALLPALLLTLSFLAAQHRRRAPSRGAPPP